VVITGFNQNEASPYGNHSLDKGDTMFKRRIILALAVLFLGLALSHSVSQTAQAQTIKLTYSNFFPPAHIQSQLAEAWCQEVNKRTNGRVQVDYFAGQTLTKAQQNYDGVVNGLSDIGFSVLAYTRGRFPVMAVVDLPLGYKSGKAATQVVNEVYDKFMPKELQDTQVMYLHAHGPGLVHTRDKAVRNLEDMKGLKFRAHGTSAEVAKALGGTPVPKPMPETYEMLQKGVVDGALYPLEAAKGWKLGEVTKYCTLDFAAAYTTSFYVVMNKDKWKALPPEDQKIIEEINKEWVVKHGQAWDDSDEEGKKFFESKGGELINLDAKEMERWKEAVAPILDEYVASMQKEGINGQEILEFTVKTLDSLQK
jgi:TRAP-type C4-dicarboxylate transport system substrate-binding protein